MKRMEESKRYIEEFKYTFDYNVEESFNTDYEKPLTLSLLQNLLIDGENKLNCQRLFNRGLKNENKSNGLADQSYR
jgi:hypothetical protein